MRSKADRNSELGRTEWLVREPAFYRKAFFVMLPMAFQQMINIGVNLMDTVMVGALGEVALSASSLANQYYYLYYILCLGVSGGACVLSAQYYGAGREEMIRQVWRLSMLLSSVAAMVFAVITYVFPFEIMCIYTDNIAMAQEGARYLQVTAMTFFFHGTSLIMVGLLRTVGVNNIGFIISGISFVVNIFFNYVFIFGKFGAPRLEIAGAALGTLLSRVAEFAITFCYVFWFCRFKFRPRDLIGKLDRVMLRSFVHTGLPPIVSDGFFTLGDNILSVILGHMSAAVVSGQAITLATMRFCTAFLMGLNGASSVMIGHEVGKGERERVQLQGKTFYLLSVAGGLLGGVLIWLVSPLVAGMYDLSAESYDATMQMMRAMSLLMVFQSVQSVMSKGVLRGGGDTRFLMFADLVFLWLLNIPLGYMAGLVWGWSPFWVFVCLKLDTIGKTLLCLWRLLSGRWIKNVNTENMPA